MRIKRISFSNINNLKGGPHEVSFDDERLSRAGIFAITGPTGSGKSTILDVITLALYNRIPRYNSKVTSPKIETDGGVMTHHTASSFALVTYEIQGKRYTSEWNVRRANNKISGKLQPYKMSLLDESGQHFDDKKMSVVEWNTKIIGLNYEQFIKSIILSQGEFAKFLKAKQNERGEILEKLTGTDIYRSISVAAYNKNKEVGQELRKQKEILAEMSILTGEELELIKKKLGDDEEQRTKVETDIKKLSSLVQTKSRIKEITKKKEILAVRKEENERLLQGAQGNRKRLAEHDNVSSLAEQLTIYNEAKKGAALGKSFLEQERKRKIEHEAALESGLKNLSLFLQKEVDADNFKKLKEAFVHAVQRKDIELDNLKEKGRNERGRIQEKVAELNADIDLKKSPELAIKQLNEQLEKIKMRREKAGIKEAENLQSIRSKAKDKQEEINTLTRVSDYLSEEKELELKIKEGAAKATENKKGAEKDKNLLDKENQVISLLKEQELLFQRRKEDALKIASLESLRADLVTGEACPLCGSTDHPLHSHKEETTSEIDSKIATVKDKMAHSLSTARELEKLVVEKEANLRMLHMRQTEYASKLEALRAQLSTLMAGRKIEPSGLAALILVTRADLTNLEDGLIAAEEGRVMRELVQHYGDLSIILDNYRAIQVEREGMYDGSDVSSEGNALEEAVTNAITSIGKSADFILDREHSTKQAEERIAEVEEILAPELRKRDLLKVSELSDLLLDTDEAEALRKELRELDDTRTSLETELASLDEDLKENEEKDYDSNLSLEISVQRLGEKESARDVVNLSIADAKARLKQDHERAEQYEKRSKIISKLKKEEAKWSLMDRMIGSAKGDKFANFAQSLTLQTLLARTNRRLAGLTDRYLLNKPNTDGTLSIIDRYQGNTERSVTTLSGGEVFIISLALALSLSDMASNNIALESLFIDEGFGTLDQETLDVAMSTLEKLQAESQKVVGVISHVEALKERITTQIQLKKNAQGYSTIEVVS